METNVGSNGNQSEVARLRMQLEEEYVAMGRMYEYAEGTARHDFLASKQRNVDGIFPQLVRLVGEEAAVETVVAVAFSEDDLA